MTEVRVNEVLEIHPGVNGDGEVVTDRSGRLRIGAAKLAVLEGLVEGRRLVSLAYDPATRAVTAVGSSPFDLVLVVAPGTGGVKVQLMRRPTLLTLANDHPRYAELLALLDTAKRERRKAAFGVLPGSLRIQDVRLLD